MGSSIIKSESEIENRTSGKEFQIEKDSIEDVIKKAPRNVNTQSDEVELQTFRSGEDNEHDEYITNKSDIDIRDDDDDEEYGALNMTGRSYS